MKITRWIVAAVVVSLVSPSLALAGDTVLSSANRIARETVQKNPMVLQTVTLVPPDRQVVRAQGQRGGMRHRRNPNPSERRARSYAIFYTLGIGASALSPFGYGLLGDWGGVRLTLSVVGCVVFLTLPFTLPLRVAPVAVAASHSA